MNKKTCNCWIGVLNIYDQTQENNLYLDSYIEKLKHESKMSFLTSTTSFLPSFSPVDYIDRRRDLANLFNFCPWCGTKINWTLLHKNIKKSN